MAKTTRVLAAAVAAGGLALALGACAPSPALAYEQVEELVSAGHGRIEPSYLVIHDTDNPGVSARNHVSYWRGAQPGVEMTQYVMELDGSVVYHVQPDDTKAWQVGRGNSHVVGIELCYATDQASFDSQFREAARWAADYLAGRGWGTDRLLSHDDCRRIWGGTDHVDPTEYFARWGRSWGEFRALVAEDMASGSTASPAPARPAPEAPGAPSGAAAATGRERAYRVTRGPLNVRTGPGTGYRSVGLYRVGDAVNVDRWRLSGGLWWGGYVARSGSVRWVCIGPATGGVSSSDYLVPAGGTTPSGTGGGERRAGTYTFRAAVNVRTGPGTGYRSVGLYRPGQSVSVRRVTQSGGYRWGEYVAYSGRVRYVALGRVGGASYVR